MTLKARLLGIIDITVSKLEGPWNPKFTTRRTWTEVSAGVSVMRAAVLVRQFHVQSGRTLIALKAVAESQT